jgi:hypothetical protein
MTQTLYAHMNKIKIKKKHASKNHWKKTKYIGLSLWFNIDKEAGIFLSDISESAYLKNIYNLSNSRENTSTQNLKLW